MRTLFFLLLLGCCRVSCADLILTLEQAAPAEISMGSDAVFNVYIRSTSGISKLAGVDFAIDAADPLQTTTAEVGGLFTSGTSNLFQDPFRIPFPTSYVLFSANNTVGLDIGQSNTLLATLTLSTHRATAGTYTMALSDIGAVEPGFAPIPVSNLSSTNLSYKIASVPEPGSPAIVGIMLVCATLRRQRRGM